VRTGTLHRARVLASESSRFEIDAPRAGFVIVASVRKPRKVPLNLRAMPSSFPNRFGSRFLIAIYIYSFYRVLG